MRCHTARRKLEKRWKFLSFVFSSATRVFCFCGLCLKPRSNVSNIPSNMLNAMLDEMLDAFDRPLINVGKLSNILDETLDAFDQGFTLSH